METAALAAELPDAYDEAGAEPEEQTAWYTPGLYRRIGMRRKPKAERPKRLKIRQRLQARGLHWNTELVVGVFVAVLVASLVTVGMVRIGAGRANDFGSRSQGTSGGAHQGGSDAGSGGSAVGGSVDFPTPTTACIAAPIPGSPLRPCTH